MAVERKRVVIGPLPEGRYPRYVCTAIVDWFEPLTLDQITANAFAAMDGLDEPFPDPNWIEIEVRG